MFGRVSRIAASAWSSARAQWVMLTTDVAGVAGGALVAYGFGLAWRPLGFIVGGAEILTVVVLVAASRAATPPKAPE